MVAIVTASILRLISPLSDNRRIQRRLRKCPARYQSALCYDIIGISSHYRLVRINDLVCSRCWYILWLIWFLSLRSFDVDCTCHVCQGFSLRADRMNLPCSACIPCFGISFLSVSVREIELLQVWWYLICFQCGSMWTSIVIKFVDMGVPHSKFCCVLLSFEVDHTTYCTWWH